jgi:hypothetical protein
MQCERLNCREFPLALRRNTRIMPVFRDCGENGWRASNSYNPGKLFTFPSVDRRNFKKLNPLRRSVA